MQKKSAPDSGFLTRRTLVALLLCAAACLIVTGTLPAFWRSETPTKVSTRTLTFAERVAYQRAIEDVYWRHRIWPKENPNAKPSLDAVMSQAQLEKKVADYLRKSRALEDYWQRPITAEHLQAEIDRMALHTKKPEVLRELFAALGNDAFVVVECLARPAITERLLTSWYGYDEKIHNHLKHQAESQLQMHSTLEQMKQLSGTYRELEFVKNDSSHQRREHAATEAIRLDDNEWNQTVQKLAGMFKEGIAKTQKVKVRRDRANFKRADAAHSDNATAQQDYDMIPFGKLSSLQQDETRYYAAAVIEKNNDGFKLATVSWQKEPVESWLARAENQAPTAIPAPQASYTLPKVSDGGTCIDNTWTATAAPPEARDSHTAVWTGSEMIIWGGEANNSLLNSGGRYDPATDTWTFSNSSGAPSARIYHTAVWTGTQMVVWGGFDNSNVVNTGGKYNPATDSWTPTSTTNAPTGRDLHTAVWTGSEMVVWGGFDDSFNDVNTGGRYNPGTDSWTATTTSNAPAARDSHTAIWSGSEMIVWGGFDNSNFVDLNTGGRYNPNANTWTSTSTNNVPDARERHTAVWTGSEMIVWGGFNEDLFEDFNTGGRYNPNTDSWTATSTVAPEARENHTAVWTGSEMIVWGGSTFFSQDFDSGGRYNPGTNSWTSTSTTNVPEARTLHTAVWTGSEMIVWGGTGGFPFGGDLNSGGRYDPLTNSWTPTNTYNVPEPRSSHTAVWTGSEMIVWGGLGQDVFSSTLNSGGRYDPATDGWGATNVADAPSPRDMHTAVWTGTEMIVWGGTGDFINFNSGSRYNPGTDGWTAMTGIAPYPRYLQTAVWTGTHMIVWGGNSDVGLLDTGGRYNPNTNTWTETSNTNAPTARDYHTAVWTGNQMIVWGGEDDNFNRVNTGGRYDPAANSWTATSTNNAPSGREFHTAVWTASEMIVWGGEDDNFTFPRSGGKYNPVTNSWVATTSIAPDGRIDHSAVWTGTQMIVWGGQGDNFGGDLNTGGQYIPGTDSWTVTSTTNAPSGRQFHTAVWTGSDTGSEMIVWGGSANGTNVNTGGRYCAEGAPIPSPTPTATATVRPTATPRDTPVPRQRPTPAPRP